MVVGFIIQGRRGPFSRILHSVMTIISDSQTEQQQRKQPSGFILTCNPKLNTMRSHGCGRDPVAPSNVVIFQQLIPAARAPVFEGACCSTATDPLIALTNAGKYLRGTKSS